MQYEITNKLLFKIAQLTARYRHKNRRKLYLIKKMYIQKFVRRQCVEFYFY